MTAKQIRELPAKKVDRPLLPEEIPLVYNAFDAGWKYESGMLYHAKLKSDLCSDGFYFSGLVLCHDNWLEIMAQQIVWQHEQSGLLKPTVVYGIATGATELGKMVAQVMGVAYGHMIKGHGKTFVASDTITDAITGITRHLRFDDIVMIVEDVFTRFTAGSGAVNAIYAVLPSVVILPEVYGIYNRGNLGWVKTTNGLWLHVKGLIRQKLNEYEPGSVTCPMCEAGSIPIKPKDKEHPENWELINTRFFAI